MQPQLLLQQNTFKFVIDQEWFFMKYLFTLLLAAVVFSFPVFSQSEVKIGNQVWMSKNLDVSTFRNGDPIPQAKTNEEWEKAGENKQPAWCYYENDPANGAKYGKLYNWYAVNDSRGLAPVGYHIPHPDEWRILVAFLGWGDEGTKMKSKSGWKSYTQVQGDGSKVTNYGNGTNTCGFSGLPGGARANYGDFYGVGEMGLWWSSTEGGTSQARSRSLYYYLGFLNGSDYLKGEGLSVRCIKD
jgi:uncharacterized protein (TIGR02145 family)